MTELLQLIARHHPWLPVALQWYAALSTASRLVLKPFSLRLQERLTRKMAEATGDDATDWATVLHARWYRWAAFALDLVFSFKLPTLAQFTAHSSQTP